MGNAKSSEKAKKDAIESTQDKRGRVSAYDTQIVHNHGRIKAETFQDQQNASIFPSCTGESKLVSDNSLRMAQKNFAESIKAVQRDEQPLVELARMTHFDVPTLRALREVFTAISSVDAEDDLISFQELCRATGARPGSLLGKAIFQLLDITRSNQINFRTWATMLSALSPEASMDEKISFAFNLYDNNGDGYIDKADLKTMLLSATENTFSLSDVEAQQLIAKAFEQADQDNDQRINLSDYRHLVRGSASFAEAFTIHVETLLAQYNVISSEEIAERVEKLRERDARQDEKINAPAQQAKDEAFMAKEEDDLCVVHDVDALDI